MMFKAGVKANTISYNGDVKGAEQWFKHAETISQKNIQKVAKSKNLKFQNSKIQKSIFQNPKSKDPKFQNPNLTKSNINHNIQYIDIYIYIHIYIYIYIYRERERDII